MNETGSEERKRSTAAVESSLGVVWLAIGLGQTPLSLPGAGLLVRTVRPSAQDRAGRRTHRPDRRDAAAGSPCRGLSRMRRGPRSCGIPVGPVGYRRRPPAGRTRDRDSASVLRPAARRLPLSTIGFMQYIAPTLQFLQAVTVCGEPFDRTRAGAFACIWVAVALFAFDSVRRRASEPVVDA
jgi:hypothetical protein